ncbi:thermonuclease family protein [Roseomonas sp. BN140053]|uniref:thermonuclease family protein n=1 Tax=Roseomonas sp. BN140053 TaxID=3391898 RepID=UPI0039EB6874
MLQRRRIFRPAQSPRRWGGVTLLAGAAVLGLLLATVSLPSDLFGSAPREQSWSVAAAEVRVVDGETLRLGNRVVRLEGLRAPARGEPCADRAGRPLDCGAAAAEGLARLVADRAVSCRLHGSDAFRRALGTCEAGGVAVNAALVSAGWAVDGSGDLSEQERAAHDAGRGLWASRELRPAGWSRR